MAFATVDIPVRASDGWVQVATSATFLVARPASQRAWAVAAVASGPPADSLRGIVYDPTTDNNIPNEYRYEGLSSGAVYVRVLSDGPEPVHFGVIRDQS